MKHFHYEVQVFDTKMPYKDPQFGSDQFIFGGLVIVTVMTQTAKEAIKKARTMLKKKYYRIGKVWDCTHEEGHELQEEMQMTQIEIQKKMYDLLKGNHV